MTERLYYTDATRTTFDAVVTARSADGRQVTLDRTAFYPTSGGQPHDLGTLGGVAVVDVTDDTPDDGDGAGPDGGRTATAPEGARPGGIVHHLAEPLDVPIGATVSGSIDWARRLDHMQQHTAQHLLSALWADAWGWGTTSVHFGATSSTIDLATDTIGADDLATMERLANAAVAEALPVTVSFEDASLAAGLRKPSRRTGSLRIITIGHLDRSACGGTHVAHTAQVGPILLGRTERLKGQVRVEFVAGHRAVARARADRERLVQMSRPLSTSIEELPAVVAAQTAQLAELERTVRRQQQELAGHDARALWNATPPDARGLRTVHLPRSSGTVRDAEPLVQALVALERVVVVVTTTAPPAIMFGASADSGLEAGPRLKALLTAHGGRGGGSARIAQGTVPDAATLQELTRQLTPPTRA